MRFILPKQEEASPAAKRRHHRESAQWTDKEIRMFQFVTVFVALPVCFAAGMYRKEITLFLLRLFGQRPETANSSASVAASKIMAVPPVDPRMYSISEEIQRVAVVAAAPSKPEFKTAEFREKFVAEEARLEGEIAAANVEWHRLVDEIREDEQKNRPNGRTASEELWWRQQDAALKKASTQLTALEQMLGDLSRVLLGEEAQWVKEQYLKFPLICEGEWAERADYFGESPEPRNRRLEKRIVVERDGKSVLVLIQRMRSHDNSSGLGDPRVAWTTRSLSQMTEAELEAIVRHHAAVVTDRK